VTNDEHLEGIAFGEHTGGVVDLDLRSTHELLALLNAEDAKVAGAVASAADALATAIDAIAARLADGGRLVYAGAGTSGLLAALDAAECGPTFSIPPGQVLALVAGGTEQLDSSAEDDADAGRADVAAAAVGRADALVAVSASGRTPYTNAALGAAAARGALTVAVVCLPDSPLAESAHHDVLVPVGAEVLVGSTRLKAGTAQKLVLNAISTVTMIRLGKTYGNLMVDVRADNEKLRTRARWAVRLATGASEAEVDAALAASGADAKVAIVSLLLGIESPEARVRLDAAGGAVRRALEGP
jgi:N-acetylmuramic acid 6-phosphate etherase